MIELRENLWTYSIAELWDLYYFHEDDLQPDEWLRVEGELARRDWQKAPLAERGCRHVRIDHATPAP